MCSKINSFGLDEVWAEHPELGTNAARLVVEINDFMAVAMMLADRGIIPRDFINDRMITQKQAKVVKYMNYARKRGTLQ